MHEIWQEIISYASQIDLLEFLGLIFGLVCVWLLIKQNILTWPAGIIYVLISLVVFWEIRLYGDFILHIFFLVLNIYGWYYWLNGKKKNEEDVPVTNLSAALPYWDSTTSILSVTGMWLTTRKKIENWYYWLAVDILATGIYVYKGIYFYSALYFVYIFLCDFTRKIFHHLRLNKIIR